MSVSIGGFSGLMGSAGDQREKLIERMVDRTNKRMREGFRGLTGTSDEDVYIDVEDAEHLLSEYSDRVAEVVENHGENAKIAIENVLGQYPKTQQLLTHQPEFFELESFDSSRGGAPLTQQSFFEQLRKSGGGRALLKSIHDTAIAQYKQNGPSVDAVRMEL